MIMVLGQMMKESIVKNGKYNNHKKGWSIRFVKGMK